MSVYLQEPGAEQADSAVVERRRADRVAVELDVTLASPTAREHEQPIVAEGINRSAAGMLLIADVPIPSGTFHVLRIDGEPATEVRVMHCRQNGDDGRYDIGVAFC
ncbi:MAG: PilZ domain-containing protein [Planctomycetota bacterium]